MKNENDVYNDIYCPNCKNKISLGNTFCSYCGNIITDVMTKKENNLIKSVERQNTVNNNENNLNTDNVMSSDGKGISNVSFLLFCFIFLPYLIETIHIFSIPSNDDGGGFFIVFGVFFVLIPTLVSFVLGINAVIKYKKHNGKKEKNRKIFNILNIVSLIIMAPFLLICGILICMSVFVPFLFS